MYERCEMVIVATVVATTIAKAFQKEGRVAAIREAFHILGSGHLMDAKELVELVMEGHVVRTYGPNTVFSRDLVPQIIERHLEVE